MRKRSFIIALVGSWLAVGSTRAEVIFEATTPYHHIQVVDARGMRTLHFDNSTETRMSLRDPLQGHFEYTEYFHLAWLWNPSLTNVLMIGLGGASAQRSFAHYYPEVTVETAEIDPVVLRVAKEFFHLRESPRQKVHVMDGRMFLRRNQNRYGAIIIDAYTESRYGSRIPYHLVTREFFELTRSRLSTNGVVAYNVIGTVRGWQSDIVGAVHRTMKEVFPEVYVFTARDSDNVVLIAATDEKKADFNTLRARATNFTRSRTNAVPSLWNRVYAMQSALPPTFDRAQILTDDFAPVDGLLNLGR